MWLIMYLCVYVYIPTNQRKALLVFQWLQFPDDKDPEMVGAKQPKNVT